MADSRDSRRDNLSVQLTSFVGREREIAQLGQFLSRTRLLTLTGSGGVGKTRLAFQVATEALEDFRDGVWLVDLAPLADPALVVQAAATTLDVPERPGRPLSDILIDFLRDKALLLVLDNCEHLLAACASLADMVLRGCPHVRILATSREPLSVPGETLWRVPSLSLPDSGRVPSVEQVDQYEALRLFVERARARDPRFAVTADNVHALVRICRRLDGIPLAIELAASRTRVLAVEQIAARLEDRFGFLTGGGGSSLPRHQTLRATMDWSYGLLGAQEQLMLRRLSVFSGSWTLEAAENVCARDGVESLEILDLLTSLVDKSLVLMETQGGEARFRLLETLRQYSRDRLQDAGQAPAVHRRHRDWYLAFAERADAKLYTSDQAAWLTRLEAEHDNLRAALDWSKGAGDGASAGLRLAAALGWFWYLHGHWTEGRAWLESAIARAADAPPSIWPKAFLGAGRITWFQGDADEARPHFEKGLALCRELGLTALTPGFFYWLGRLAWNDGDVKRATALLDEGLVICREREDTWWACQLLAERGEVASARGDDAKAEKFYSEGLAISRATGAINNSMLFLHNLGVVAQQRARVQEAAEYYAQSLALCRHVQHRSITVSCLEGLARIASGQADHARAARLFGAASALGASLGQRRNADQADRERRLAATQGALGEPAFQKTFDEGKAMTLEQAIDYALSPGTAAPRMIAAGGSLTAREQEVAALVAQGMTNREIASALVVTERTAETHVQNILNKLGVNSRAQVATWAVEQGLKKPAVRQ